MTFRMRKDYKTDWGRLGNKLSMVCFHLVVVALSAVCEASSKGVATVSKAVLEIFSIESLKRIGKLAYPIAPSSFGGEVLPSLDD